MTSLEILDVSRNRIKIIPPKIANLTSLKVLAIAKNKIEEDKKARREKEALEKALRDGTALPDAAANQASNVQKPTAAASAPTAAATNSARLQIRLPSGPPLTTTRPGDDTLQSVLTWVQEQAPAIALQGSIMTTYPRKTYDASDFGKTLKELGLTPSSVLVIS